LETVRLKQNEQGIFYIPIVQEQNNKKPVSFKMTESDKATFTFENKEHDFPQRIIYRIINPDSVVARIEGVKNGKPGSFDYYYKRIK
jgi:hypothetical protein